MSFRLPSPSQSAIRELMGDVAHIASVLDPANLAKLPTLAAGLRQARAAHKDQRFTALVLVVLDEATDERWLIRVGKRGGWRKLWNFGNGRD